MTACRASLPPTGRPRSPVPPGSRVLVFEHPEYGRWEVEVEVLEGDEMVLGDVVAPADESAGR